MQCTISNKITPKKNVTKNKTNFWKHTILYQSYLQTCRLVYHRNIKAVVFVTWIKFSSTTQINSWITTHENMHIINLYVKNKYVINKNFHTICLVSLYMLFLRFLKFSKTINLRWSYQRASNRVREST